MLLLQLSALRSTTYTVPFTTISYRAAQASANAPHATCACTRTYISLKRPKRGLPNPRCQLFFIIRYQACVLWSRMESNFSNLLSRSLNSSKISFFPFFRLCTSNYAQMDLEEKVEVVNLIHFPLSITRLQVVVAVSKEKRRRIIINQSGKLNK